LNTSRWVSSVVSIESMIAGRGGRGEEKKDVR